MSAWLPILLMSAILVVDAVVSEDVVINSRGTNKLYAAHSLTHILLLRSHAPTRHRKSFDLSVHTLDAVLFYLLVDLHNPFKHIFHLMISFNGAPKLMLRINFLSSVVKTRLIRS